MLEALHSIWEPVRTIILYPFEKFLQINERVFLPYLLIALLLALAVYIFQERKNDTTPNCLKGFFKYCFPKEVYKHNSAILDYKYFWVGQIAYLIFVLPVGGLLILFSDNLVALLGSVVVSPFVVESGVINFQTAPVLLATYTLVLALATDFGVFYAHYIFHKYPKLWHFHKVHHSAEVMTPITVYRMHPFDQLVTALVAGSIGAVVSAIFRFLFAPDLAALTIGSVGVITLFFYIFGYNLRHSHVWLHYPKWLAAVFISPAQHQVHHSIDVKHYDKNFGLVFSFWDRLFGTLYLPEGKEEITYGLKRYKGQRHQHHTVRDLLWGPVEDVLGKELASGKETSKK